MYNPAAAGGNSGYIPAATEGMIVGWSKNLSEFPLARYSYYKPVEKKEGLYRWVNPAPQMRLGTNPATAAVWATGAASPSPLQNQTESEFIRYSTQRYRETVETDKLAIAQDDWAVQDADAKNIAVKAMTRRTWMAHQTLGNAANWGTANSASVDSAATDTILTPTTGGTSNNWANATPETPNMMKAINYVARQITKLTAGTVRRNGLIMVINPDTASAMAETAEIQNFLKQNERAIDVLTGLDREIAEYTYSYGLPPMMRGVRFVVEDTPFDAAAIPGVAYNPEWIMADNTAYFLSVPGKKFGEFNEGKEDRQDTNMFSTVNSTLTAFMFEDMTVETWDEARERRVDATVTSDYQFQLVGPYSGFLLKDLFGSAPGADD